MDASPRPPGSTGQNGTGRSQTPSACATVTSAAPAMPFSPTSPPDQQDTRVPTNSRPSVLLVANAVATAAAVAAAAVAPDSAASGMCCLLAARDGLVRRFDAVTGVHAAVRGLRVSAAADPGGGRMADLVAVAAKRAGGGGGRTRPPFRKAPTLVGRASPLGSALATARVGGGDTADAPAPAVACRLRSACLPLVAAWHARSQPPVGEGCACHTGLVSRRPAAADAPNRSLSGGGGL